MPTPSSGTISMFDINSAFNRGNDLNAYRGTVWYLPNSLTTGTFPSGQIAFSDFYNKTGTNPAPPSPIPIVYGVGTYQFVVPLFRTSLTVKLNGAGGGGGGIVPVPSSYADTTANGIPRYYSGTSVNGTNGGDTSFNAPSFPMIAGGGKGGGYSGSTIGAGAGGIATGGTVNTNGSAGFAGNTTPPPNGGNSGSGAAGGIAGTSSPAILLFIFGSRLDNGVYGGTNGSNYGAGGAGAMVRGGKFVQDGRGGGGGAYCERTFTNTQLVPGTTVNLVVGSVGIGACNSLNSTIGNGGQGNAVITWT